MTKRLSVLAIACLCVIVHIRAATYGVQIGNLHYSVDTETLEAKVTDASKDISGDVVIPASIDTDPDGVMRTYTVTSIGESAFLGCSALTSVTIPNSVDSIGEFAFEVCTSLASVTIPNSVTSIGDLAFLGCSSLTSVTIPNSVTSIGYGAFLSCTSLTSVTIPNSVTSIGDAAFGDCSSLTSIEVESGNTNYTSSDGILYNKGMTTLLQCPGAKTAVDIPNTVTAIGYGAFSSCTSLTSVTIPNSVTSIGSRAFSNCTSLTSIEVESGNPIYASFDGILYNKDMTTLLQCPGAKTAIDIPNTVTAIGYGAFSSCTSLTSVTIPNSVTSIGEWAFSGCTSLASVTIPNSVTSIGFAAFSGCSSLASVTIHNSVISIGNEAFYGCSALTSVTISESVTSIGENAFSSCASLISIEVESGNPNYTSLDGILYNKEMTTLLQCPGAKTAVDIPNSVTSIGIAAFYGCSSLASVTIPNSVTSIGVQAFNGCTKLEKIYCMWETPITCYHSAWDYDNYSNATLYVPEGCIPAYQSTDPWSSFLNIKEHSISGIDPMTVGNEAKTIVATYDISGKPVAPDTKGLVIVRYSDGSVAKVVNRDR